MLASVLLAGIITLLFIFDTFIFLPRDVKIISREHLLDGDKSGYITGALKLSYSKIKQGQVWRLISQVFLHVGIPHLVFNIFAILVAGDALEPTTGWLKMMVGFFFSAFFSSLIMAFGLHFEDGEGASTGIYGLLAMYMVLAIRNRSVLFSGLPWYLVVLLGVFAVVGMCTGRINRWEHATGFFGGLLFSILFLLR